MLSRSGGYEIEYGIWKKPSLEHVPTLTAACYFYLGMYRKAEDTIQRAPHSSLQNRVQEHFNIFLKPLKTFFRVVVEMLSVSFGAETARRKSADGSS